MTSLPKILAEAARPALSSSGIWRKPALSARGAAAWKKRLGEAFGDNIDDVESATTAATSSENEPSTSTSTSSDNDNNHHQQQQRQQKPPPKPFGFRRFKGHKHDREAAARRARTEEYLSSGAAERDVAAHRAARREGGVAGASPIDRLLTQASELRKRVGRSVPASGGGGGGKKK